MESRGGRQLDAGPSLDLSLVCKSSLGPPILGRDLGSSRTRYLTIVIYSSARVHLTGYKTARSRPTTAIQVLENHSSLAKLQTEGLPACPRKECHHVVWTHQ